MDFEEELFAFEDDVFDFDAEAFDFELDDFFTLDFDLLLDFALLVVRLLDDLDDDAFDLLERLLAERLFAAFVLREEWVRSR